MFKALSSLWNRNSKPSPSNTKPLFTEDPSVLEFASSEPSEPGFRPEIPDTETSFTFKVDPVEFSRFSPQLTSAESLLRWTILCNGKKENVFQGKLEDFSHREDKEKKYLDPKVPGLVGVLHTAFECHYALSLSVSDFIILIGQGLGAHINKGSEKLRKHFVEHEGREKIMVIRDDFVLGGQNDWSTVFGEFAEQIRKKVKADVYGVIVDDTSVATATSRIVSEIILMEAMKKYLTYQMNTYCGIPEITLEGKREDWEKLKEKVRKLVEMNKDDCLGLKWWLDELVPIVEKICEAGIERKVDVEFWSNIYKHHSMSGEESVYGWIIKFFPYVSDRRNKFDVIKTNMVPKQVCEVPFVWKYQGKDMPMQLTAGFLGTEFSRELRQVKAAHFWCVTQAESKLFGLW